MKLFSVLALVAVATASSIPIRYPTASTQHAEVLADLDNAWSQYKTYHPLAAQMQRMPKHFQSMAAASGGKSPNKIQTPCSNAWQTVINDFQACPTLQTAGQQIFAPGSSPNQTSVGLFCTAPCIVQFHTDLNSMLGICTPVQVVAIEIVYSIRFFDLIFALNVPCVQDPNNPGIYCLPGVVASFQHMSTVGNNVQPSDLAPPNGLCTACLGAWLVEIFKYAPINDLFLIQTLGIACAHSLDSAGNTVWCLPSFVHSSQTCQPGLTSTCLNEICANDCYQKIIIKLYLANPAAGNNTGVNIGALLFVLDLSCTTDPVLGYCGNVFTNLNNTGKALMDACGADYSATPRVCGATCDAAAQTFLDSTGCCFQTLTGVEVYFYPLVNFGHFDITNPHELLRAIDSFIAGDCGNTLPPICDLNQFVVTATIVVRNLAFDAYITAKAIIHEKVLLDVAGYLGVRGTQLELAGQGDQVQAIAGTALQGATPGGVSFTINSYPDNNVPSSQVTGNAQNANGNLGNMPMGQLNGLGVGFTHAGFQDQGYYVDSAASSVTAAVPATSSTGSSTGKNSAAAVIASPLVVLAAVFAALLL